METPKSDLQGTNRGRTLNAGWCQNDFLPWMQDQELILLIGYGIGYCLLVVLAVILGVGLCTGIHSSQDKIQAMVQPIHELSEEAFDKILRLLGRMEAKVMDIMAIPTFGLSG